MLAGKGALRKRSGEAGRSFYICDQWMTRTASSGTPCFSTLFNPRDIASHLPTEIVMCLQ